MNELLQRHGCSNVFTIPDGLKELMSDISREVLREQPVRIYEFIANYLSALLVTREHGILAVKILEDLCDCRPSVSEHLMQYGMPKEEAHTTAEIIKQEVEKVNVVEGREKLKEAEIIKKILKRIELDEEMTANVCQVARNAYKDYWYRKKLLEQSLKTIPDQPWEIAAERTIEIYKKTKPSFSELTRATQKIQAAYKGYYVRKKMLKHLKPKKKHAPKVDLFGPPLDVAESRNIDLGRVVEVKVKTENVERMFADEDSKSLGLSYDPTKTITNVLDEFPVETEDYRHSDVESVRSEAAKAESVMVTKGMRSTPEISTKQSVTVQEAESRMGVSNRELTAQGAESRRGISSREVTAQEAESRMGMSSRELTAQGVESRKGISSREVTAQEAESRMGVSNRELTAQGAESRKGISFGPPSYDDAETPMQEIPEEIVTPVDVANVTSTIVTDDGIEDDRIEDDTASAPLTSEPSSVPTTAPSTDIEDMTEFSGEEEG